MKPSPLTFTSLKFLRVHVAVDFKAERNEDDFFDFAGNSLGWSIRHGQHSDGQWWVAVGFRNSNESSKTKAPYHIDINAIGTFRAPNNFPEKNIYESGGALVYSAIRDMVSSITSRSIPGHVMLPTPTFMGEYDVFLNKKNEDNKEANSVTSQPATKAKRSTARKTRSTSK